MDATTSRMSWCLQGINGTVPDLTNLVNLTVFNLAGNDMTGGLPGLPHSLWTLELSSNMMTGELPNAYGMLLTTELRQI